MRMPSCARGSRSHDGKRNYAIVQFLLQTGLQLDECRFRQKPDITIGSFSVSKIGQSIANGTRRCARVWGHDTDLETNVLEVHMGHLRQKLETHDDSRLIQTIRGVGYVLRG